MTRIYTVLVAVDDKASQLLYQEELGGMGLNVLSAGNGLQVIGMLGYRNVDLLLTDLKMPEVPVVELISYVCGTYPGLPAIVISDYYKNVMNNLSVRGQKVRACFGKPAMMSEVKGKIREILGMAGG